MQDIRLSLFAAMVILLLACLEGVSSQGLMGGFKGHHHRGTGAVELLLATGILAKLLNHRAKYGPSYAGRNILHALIGGPRYPPRYTHGRFPLDATAGLLQDELTEGHAASMSIPFHDELLLGGVDGSSLFSGSKNSPLLLGPTLDGQLLTEAHIGQQLMAARRARKMLEARKLLAAQEATKNLLVAQSQAAQLFAAQEVTPSNFPSFLQATPSRQVLSSAPAPPRMISMPMSVPPQMSQMPQMGPVSQMSQMNHGQESVMMGSERTISSRSDPRLFTLPAGLSERETAQIIASLASRGSL